MALLDVNDTDFEEKVLKSKTPVLVDFWAPWCAPCKMAELALEELSQEYKGKIQIVRINVDENKQSGDKNRIMAIPTTVLFKNGEEIDRQVGFTGKEAFEDLLKKGM